jgi:hypothetical protein
MSSSEAPVRTGQSDRHPGGRLRLPRACRQILCGVVALSSSAAYAQIDVSAMRECRRIADTAARVACYDAIPLGEAQAAPAATPQPRGFGSNQLPRSEPERAAEPEEVTATVANAVEREPGVYLLTFEDGTQWQFVDAAPRSYAPPRRGSRVEIIAASMGSYLLRFGEQRALRVRRVR